MPALDFYLEKGVPLEEAKKRVLEDVYGVGFKLDRHGRPIEQGIGSQLAAVRIEHERKLQEAKAVHDKVLAEDRVAFANECHARLEAIKREEARVEHLKGLLDNHLQEMAQMNRGRAAVA